MKLFTIFHDKKWLLYNKQNMNMTYYKLHDKLYEKFALKGLEIAVY